MKSTVPWLLISILIVISLTPPLSGWTEAANRSTSPPTFTSYNVTPNIGTNRTEFAFKLEYTDLDGDLPDIGYPKLYLYSDVFGNVNYKNGTYQMSGVSGLDMNVTNGKMYQLKLCCDNPVSLDDCNAFSYKYQIKSDKESDIITTSLLHGPLVDYKPVEFLNSSIQQDTWHTTDVVNCSITMDDGAGTGVNGSQMKYRYSRSGLGNLTRWYPKPSVPDEMTISVYQVQVFSEGDQNYFQWSACDVAGNGPTMSDLFRVRVDTAPISFYGPDPPPGSRTLSDTVDFQIYLTDTDQNKIAAGLNVSGVDMSSLQFRYRSQNGAWCEWGAYGLAISQENETAVLAKISDLPLSNGTNYVQVRGTDMAGNGDEDGYSLSDEFSILRANNAPTPPEWITPNSTSNTRPRILWGPGHDVDKDPLTYYIQIGIPGIADYVIPWTPTGQNRYYDLHQGLQSYMTYIVQVKCNDSKEFSGVRSSVLNITGASTGIPPSSPTDISCTYTAMGWCIRWAASFDPDNQNLTYFIRVGTSEGSGDIINWTQAPFLTWYALPSTMDELEGIYSVEVQAFDGESFSESAQTTLKLYHYLISISDFQFALRIGEDITHTVILQNNGTNSDNVTLCCNGTIFQVATIYVDGELYDPSVGTGIAHLINTSGQWDISMRFQVPEDALEGNYTLNLYAYSENGELSGCMENGAIKVEKNEENSGVPEKPDKTYADYFNEFWWVILIIQVILFIACGMYIVQRGRAKGKAKKTAGGAKTSPRDAKAAQGGTKTPLHVEPMEETEMSKMERSGVDIEPPPEGFLLEQQSALLVLPAEAMPAGDSMAQQPETEGVLPPAEALPPTEQPALEAAPEAATVVEPAPVTKQPTPRDTPDGS